MRFGLRCNGRGRKLLYGSALNGRHLSFLLCSSFVSLMPSILLLLETTRNERLNEHTLVRGQVESAAYFKQGCEQAYSYAYDDKTSLFACGGGDVVVEGYKGPFSFLPPSRSLWRDPSGKGFH